MKQVGWLSLFVLGLVCGLLLFTVLESFETGKDGLSEDPRDVGLGWAWLAFGFIAQAVFMCRFLVQWIATERARSSVVPTAFWWLSLFGGLMLLTYFVRRGDPVGVAGQLFGVVVYVRNLFFIRREAAEQGGESESEQAVLDNTADAR
ncbi:MAG: lipid-A-disaccharide synthase N-terminal domain-containing protein [Acidobacteriota bacterium]